MISILLLKKIAELFVMIFMGYALVRCKQMTVEDSRPLSVVSLYLLNPCVIISSFQIQRTPELMNSLALSLAGALLILSSFVIIGTLLRRPLHMGSVEQASITYSNCANLLIPIIASILGPEWVIFANVFYVVQMFLFWTHCKTLISGERSISLRKLFLNPNIIACFVGGILFLANIRLPAIVGNAVSTIGGMLGPVGMLITGMLMAGVDLKKIIRDPGVWRASFLRPDLRAELDAHAFVDSRYRATVADASVRPGLDGEERRMREIVRLNFDWFMQTLLDRKDRMSMYHGLEVRVPFCDWRIAEYLYSVPWAFKDWQGREKGLLREAMRGLLPEEVLWRKKSPYPKTHHPAYLALVSRRLREVLDDPDAPLFRIVDPEAARRLLDSTLTTPWYGQLMTVPQTIAYLLQVNYWLGAYHVRLV